MATNIGDLNSTLLLFHNSVSQSRHNLIRFSAQGLTKLKSKDWDLLCGSGFSFKLIQVVGRTQLLVVVGLMSLFSCLFIPRDCSQQLETTTLRSLACIAFHRQLRAQKFAP